MNSEQQSEEQLVSVQQAQHQIDPKDVFLDLREPIFANTIAFNGEIISEPVDVGGGFVAFNILAGKDKEEMPLILIKDKIENVNRLLVKGDKIAAVGFLKKIQGQFTIEVAKINRMPTKEEIQELIALPTKWVTDFKGISGLNGRIFAKTQVELDGTFNDDTMLFIPAAGSLDGSTHSSAGSYCYLWSSSLNLDSPNYAWYLEFYSGSVGLSGDGDRCLGYSVRCVSTNK